MSPVGDEKEPSDAGVNRARTASSYPEQALVDGDSVLADAV
jgi:hypothetical protein